MKSLKLHILAILFMLPFLGSDLYSKYLAYQHLGDESDHVVINDYVYAGLPLRNYGWIGSEYPVEVNSFTNISSNIASVLIGIFIYCLLYSLETFWTRLNCGMLAGGAWGNGLESVIYRGGTDFLYIHDTGTFWIYLLRTWQMYLSSSQYSYSFWFHSLNAYLITCSINGQPQRCRDASVIGTVRRRGKKL